MDVDQFYIISTKMGLNKYVKCFSHKKYRKLYKRRHGYARRLEK